MGVTPLAPQPTGEVRTVGNCWWFCGHERARKLRETQADRVTARVTVERGRVREILEEEASHA